MLHIIIVLGGTVFTEGGHYSLVNSVRVGGGGGDQNKGGDQIHYDTGIIHGLLGVFFLANIS